MLLIEKIKKFTRRKYKIEECDISDKKCISGTVGIFVAAVLVVLIVTTVVYTLYLFVSVSGLSNLAGVHVTASIKNATNEIINGKVEPLEGYDGWLMYRGDSFEFRYPEDWTLQKMESDKEIVILKKYNNTGDKRFESLAATIIVGKTNLPESLSMKEFLNEKGIEWRDDWKRKMIAGNPGISTGKIKTETGIIKEVIFWDINGIMYSIEGDYLNSNNLNDENTFEKILAQLKFI